MSDVRVVEGNQSTAAAVEKHVIGKEKTEVLVVPEKVETARAMERFQLMDKPAPVPPGHIAVEIPNWKDGWYLAKLDSACESCEGDGANHTPANPHPREGEVRLNYCPTCIIRPLDLFVKEFNRIAQETREAAEAEKRAERSDSELAKRLNEAHLRVVAMEKERDEALGQNKLDVASTKETIAKCKSEAERFAAQREEYARRLNAAAADFLQETKDARKWFDEEKRKLEEQLAGKQAEIERRRRTYSEDHGKCTAKLDDEIKANTRLLDESQAALAKYLWDVSECALKLDALAAIGITVKVDRYIAPDACYLRPAKPAPRARRR